MHHCCPGDQKFRNKSTVLIKLRVFAEAGDRMKRQFGCIYGKTFAKLSALFYL